MVVQEKPTHRDSGRDQGSTDRKHRLKQRFQVMKKLGQGTYGKVQLAVNKETRQEVAIKTIKKAKIENEQDLVRIRREIQIMSSIQHPHIIHIYEVFENHEKIVLIMQYASGGELYDYLGCHRNLPEIEARRIFRQIAAAIYYCHKNKICHRDLKLENILLDDKGNAKIADFGLSNVFDDRHKLRTFCGSPLYASPEIVKGSPYYGPEVDCWSLGVLLYTLVYGSMPFDGSNFKRLVRQISEGDYYEPKKKSEASGLIRRLLTVDVSRRATIRDICADWWVNRNYDHSLLRVADDMANLTPVRLDLLLALSSVSPLPPETGTKMPTNSSSRKEEARPSDIAAASEAVLPPGQMKRRERQAKLSTKMLEDSRHPQPLIDDHKGGNFSLGANENLFHNGCNKIATELDSAVQPRNTSAVSDSERKACDILGEVHLLVDDVIASVEKQMSGSKIALQRERATNEEARGCPIAESKDQVFRNSNSSENPQSFLAERSDVRKDGSKSQSVEEQPQLEDHETDATNRKQSFRETTTATVERKSSDISRLQHNTADITYFPPSSERTHPTLADGNRSAAEKAGNEVKQPISERNRTRLSSGGNVANTEGETTHSPRGNGERRTSPGIGSKERRIPPTEPASVLPIFDVFSNIPKRHVTSYEHDAERDKAHKAHVIKNLRREARIASHQQQELTLMGTPEVKRNPLGEERNAKTTDGVSNISRRNRYSRSEDSKETQDSKANSSMTIYNSNIPDSLPRSVPSEEMDGREDSLAHEMVEIPKRSQPASCGEMKENLIASKKEETEKQSKEHNEPPKIPPKNRFSFKIPKPLVATNQGDSDESKKGLKREEERENLKQIKTNDLPASDVPKGLQMTEMNGNTAAIKNASNLPQRSDADDVTASSGGKAEPTVVKSSEEISESKVQEGMGEAEATTPKAAQRKSRRDIERRIASSRSKQKTEIIQTDKAEIEKEESKSSIPELETKRLTQFQEKKVTFHEGKGEVPDAGDSRSEDSKVTQDSKANSSMTIHNSNIPDSLPRQVSENSQHNTDETVLEEAKCFNTSDVSTAEETLCPQQSEMKEITDDINNKRLVDICKNEDNLSREKTEEEIVTLDGTKEKQFENHIEANADRNAIDEAVRNSREFVSEIPKKPKRRSLSRTRGMSMEFERLAEQPRQRLGPPKKPPGKIQIPKYFDPSQGIVSPRTPEKKEIIFVPTRSVSENKEKIERKIEKVKKAAIVIPPRRKSDAGMNPRKKKYTRSQTDFLPRNVDATMQYDDENEVDHDLEQADDENGRNSSLGQPCDSECVEMMDVSQMESESWQPVDHDEEMRDVGSNKTALDSIQQKNHRHSMDSESGYWTPTEMTAGTISGSPQEMKGGSETVPHLGIAIDFKKMTARERSAISLKNAKLRLMLSDEGLDNCSLSSSLESGINSWKHDEGSMKRLSPEGESEDKSTSAPSLQDEFLQSGPVPITRSYKKMTFSPEDELNGECDENDIQMENENWDLETEEKNLKSNIEEVETENANGKVSSALKASESHSSSGSNDISDDVFENWVGGVDSAPTSSRGSSSNHHHARSDAGHCRGQSKEQERRERKWHSSEWWSSYSTDKDSSDNDDDLDIMVDDFRPTVYGSEGLWQFLKSVNKDLSSHLKALKKPSKPAWLRSKSQECRDPEELGTTQKTMTRSLSREDKQTRSDAQLRHYTSEGKLFANSDFTSTDLTSEDYVSSKDYPFKAGSMDGIYKWEKEFMGITDEDDDNVYQPECREKASLYGTLRSGTFDARRYGQQHLEQRRHSLRGREGEKCEDWAQWKSMQSIDNTEGLYMADSYCQPSRPKSPLTRRLSLYGTLRQNNLTQKDRATSQIVLNTDDGYQILYNDNHRRSKIDAQSRTDISDLSYPSGTMSKALSEMDVSHGETLHKRLDKTFSVPYQQETIKSLPRFSKSLGSRLNLESCITQTPVVDKTSDTLKETNVKRRVSFSSNLDTPRAHNSSLHYLHSMNKLRGAQEELFGTNSSVSILKDEPSDTGSLLEALKTQGYRSIMSQRLQPAATDAGRLNQRYLTGICPPSSPKSAFDNLDYILRDSQSLLQQNPTYPSSSDYGRVSCYATLSPSLSRKNWTADPAGLFYQRPAVTEMPNSFSMKLTDDLLLDKHKYRDAYGSKASTDPLQQFSDPYRGDLSSTWKTTLPGDGHSDTPRVRQTSKSYQLRQNKSVEQQQDEFLDEEEETEAPVTRSVEDSIGQLSEKIKALKSRCQRKSLDEGKLKKELAEVDGLSIPMLDSDKENKRERQTEAVNYDDLDSPVLKTNGKEESVSDRIWRKSFYSRFNDLGTARRRKSSFLDSELLQDCKFSGSINKYDMDLEGGGEASWVMAPKGRNDASYTSSTLPRQMTNENLLSSYSQKDHPYTSSYANYLSKKNAANEEFSSNKTDRRTIYPERMENGDDFRFSAKGYLPTLYFEGNASSDPELLSKRNERLRLPEHALSDNDNLTQSEKRKVLRSCPPCSSQRSHAKDESTTKQIETNPSGETNSVNCDKTECRNLVSQMNGLESNTESERSTTSINSQDN